MTTKNKRKSVIVCPYGTNMNELATPTMQGHMSMDLWVWCYLHRAGVKPHHNVQLGVRWQNRFRKYKRVLC